MIFLWAKWIEVAQSCLTLCDPMDYNLCESSMWSSYTLHQPLSHNGGLVAMLCPTLVTPWIAACQAPPSMRILQARILEWVAIYFSRGSSWLRDRNWVSCITGRFFTDWAMRVSYCNKIICHLSQTISSLKGHIFPAFPPPVLNIKLGWRNE